MIDTWHKRQNLLRQKNQTIFQEVSGNDHHLEMMILRDFEINILKSWDEKVCLKFGLKM